MLRIIEFGQDLRSVRLFDTRHEVVCYTPKKNHTWDGNSFRSAGEMWEQKNRQKKTPETVSLKTVESHQNAVKWVMIPRIAHPVSQPSRVWT